MGATPQTAEGTERGSCCSIIDGDVLLYRYSNASNMSVGYWPSIGTDLFELLSSLARS